jgi:Cu(I)/Ag(I) efflux system membrane fusion protein
LWQGQVEYIYPALDAKTRSLKVRLEFDNPGEELKPAMYADVVIEGPAKPGVLTIPREALIRTGRSERVVLALGDGRFRSVEVVSGMEADGSVEILEGLDDGAEVVVSAQFLIDSESSLKASFIRMDDAEPAMDMEMDMARAEPAIEGVGVVNEVMAGDRKVNLTHEPIPAISWPTMTMGFDVAEDVDLSALKAGDRIRFTLGEMGVGMYRILSVRPAD